MRIVKMPANMKLRPKVLFKHSVYTIIHRQG